MQHHSKIVVDLQLVHGWDYILMRDWQSELLDSPNIGVVIINVSDNWSLHMEIYVQ